VRRVREEELPDHTLTLRYRFVHVLYQNALYLSLTPARKASLASAVAHAIIAFYGDQSPAAELALLFDAARDFSNAADHFKRAARNAAAVAAYHEAVLLARRGLALLRSLPETPERDQRELSLLITLGVPLTASQSYASPEVGEVYARARELALRSESPQVFPVLHGLYRFYFVRGELASALELSEQLLERAERVGESSMLMEAHRAMGNTLFYRGETIRGREHLDTAIGLYEPERHGAHTLLYGIDPSAAGRTVAALALWTQGYPNRARELTHEAVTRARQLKHPFTLAWTLTYLSLLYQNCGDAAATRAAAEEGLRLATEHAFPFWRAASTIMRARAAFDEGADPGPALQEMHDGLNAWLATGAQISAPYFLTLLADAAISAGRFQEARDAILEAITKADHDREHWWLADQYRVQAVLLVKESASLGAPLPPDAELYAQRALDTARQQGAKSLELRAAMTLARIRAIQGGGAKDGLQVVRDVLASFTEGFDTADLKLAAALLAEQKTT
jgi:adenylate cyclase